jgi:hypothetical protein
MFWDVSYVGWGVVSASSGSSIHIVLYSIALQWLDSMDTPVTILKLRNVERWGSASVCKYVCMCVYMCVCVCVCVFVGVCVCV